MEVCSPTILSWLSRDSLLSLCVAPGVLSWIIAICGYLIHIQTKPSTRRFSVASSESLTSIIRVFLMEIAALSSLSLDLTNIAPACTSPDIQITIQEVSIAILVACSRELGNAGNCTLDSDTGTISTPHTERSTPGAISYSFGCLNTHPYHTLCRFSVPAICIATACRCSWLALAVIVGIEYRVTCFTLATLSDHSPVH